MKSGKLDGLWYWLFGLSGAVALVCALVTIETGLSWLWAFLTYNMDKWQASQMPVSLDFFQSFFVTVASAGLALFFYYVMARGRLRRWGRSGNRWP